MKYSKEIQSIRKESKLQILGILKGKSLEIKEIIKILEDKNSEKYDESVKCVCGKMKGTSPEWKHQVRWAILDLKYTKKIILDENNKKYSLG